MKHRLFIAINLAEEIKKDLGDYQNKWRELPVRWTKPDNLHLTLVFIGDTEEVLKIKEAINRVIVRHKPFRIVLDKISYSPHKEGEVPRMVWVNGSSKEFLSLKNDLEKELGLKPENREGVVHITLARIKEWEWRRIEPDERPEIEESINLEIKAESIELMESQLKRSGPEYTILESFKL